MKIYLCVLRFELFFKTGIGLSDNGKRHCFLLNIGTIRRSLVREIYK